MKPVIIIVLLSILIGVQGCIEREVEENDNRIKHLADLTLDNTPQKKWINFDSLEFKIPGKNGVELPEIFISDMPQPTEIKTNYELVPGVSNLPQTQKEIRDNVQPIKSKKPLVIKYAGKSVENNIQFEQPIITHIPNSIHISYDSLSYFKDIAIRSGEVSLQHSDSIFPPINLQVRIPYKVKALPFDHSDFAIFDIRTLGEDQDLPNSFIREIKKDNKGVIWFATHTGGLISYDGQYFSQYTTANGISSDMVISLLIDRNNNLWIGTQDNGVNLYDGNSITQFTKDQGLPSNSVNEIMEDREGNIWFATVSGACKFDGKTLMTYSVKSGGKNLLLTSIHEDDKGDIWFGTSDGVVKFNPNQSLGNDGIMKFTYLTKKDGLAHNVVLSIAHDSNGNMWIGTYGGGVSKFDGTTFTNYTTDQGLGNNDILSIIEDLYGNIWFGTFGNGVTRFNGESFSHYTTEQGLCDNYVRSLFDDDEGNLWVGTDGGGVSNFTMNSFKHFTTNNGLSNNLVLSIFQDEENRMWFGTFEGGVLIYDEPKTSGMNGSIIEINTDNGLANNTIASIIKDNNNNYWLATFEYGVSMIDGASLKTGKLKLTNYSKEQGFPSEIVRSVLQDNDGNIWFGTEGGVVRFDGEKFITITEDDGLGENKTVAVYQDNSGSIWFGSIGGGVTRLRNDTLTNFTVNHGLGDNTVWTIIQDNNGILWFGTNGGGLTCFDGNSFNTFNTKDGLSNNYVYSLIIDDDNQLWIGTTKGLNQINLVDSLGREVSFFDQSNPVIINYGKMEGLKSLDFYTNSALHDDKNRLWWGTTDALSMLDINKYKLVESGPKSNFNELIINNKLIDYRKLKSDYIDYRSSGISFSDVSQFSNIPVNLKLPYDADQITIRFSATDWLSPSQVQYQYMLSGFEKDWNMVTKNTEVDYRNVDPGNYTFMLRAIGKSRNWGDVSEYSFIIKPPYWATWWAIIFYTLLFALSIWLLIRWRVNIVKQQKIVLENLIYDRTKELDNSRKSAEKATIAKSQFIATMSHEIRTPLNAIMGLTHLAINTSPNSKQEDYLQKIDRSANTLLSLINDILDFSKIEAGKMKMEKANFDLEILINSVIVLNAQDACKKEIEFVVNFNSQVPKLLIGDPLRIGQVITNLVSNAIKFTSSGEVVINIDIGKKISDKELKLQVSVADSGIGINEKTIPFLFDEFSQADSSITRKYGGSGLGLTICKKIITMMKGRIWLESEPKKGSTFYFDCVVGVQSWKTTAHQSIPKELKQFNLLVCDNNPKSLESLVKTIESFSIKVDALASSESVLSRLKEKSYELLLIDEKQKGMSGTDTIIAIQKDKGINPLKSILITDSKLSSKKKNIGTVHINGYLTKPNIPSVVLEQILSAFGMQKLLFKQRDEDNKYAELIRKSVTSCNVLLAEDNELNTQLVFELLYNVGINVDVVDNGKIAVQKVKSNNYDLVLMDIHMPVMDGYTAAANIRKFNTIIPIIAITADAMDSIKVKCKQAGINDILIKPISPNLLYEAVFNCLKSVKLNIDAVDLSNKNIDSNPFKLSILNLDTQNGIKRFGDNATLYMNMLVKFAERNNIICNEISELVKLSNFEKAHLMVHTLKGESGNIGADKVFELSKIVEDDLLIKDKKAINSSLVKLGNSISDVIMAINSNQQVEEYINNSDTVLINELVVKLIDYLTLNDPKTFDVLDQLATTDIGKPELNAIIKAINSNKIEEAIILLKKL